VVGGQALSLLLTLVAVPVIYSLLDDVGDFFNRRRAAAPAPAPDIRPEVGYPKQPAAATQATV
jgi:hypothetical protein